MTHTRIAILSGAAMILWACPQGQRPQSFTFDSVGSAASLGNYAATCQQLRMSQPRVRSVAPGTFTLGFPASAGGDGSIRNLSVNGVFEADLEVGTSPAILLGPPACAAAAAVFVRTSRFVVDAVVTGSVDWKFGTQDVTSGVHQKNAVITSSILQLPTFDVHDAAPVFDDLTRDLAKRQVQCAVDAALVDQLNRGLLQLTGGELTPGLPVYAPGVNPHGGC